MTAEPFTHAFQQFDEAIALAEHAARQLEEALQARHGSDYRVPQEISSDTFEIAYQVLSDLAAQRGVEI